ncbi:MULTISPECIES: hypothetical protein [unclassified Nocardioides]|uniref:hypothetical protein n=1 Tax=unclassified Nocardioides TaxID=2615069 RepID=UPI000B025B86|nr:MULTISPECIES: hypothetical protein [unclassified Nocardioides]
MTEPTPAQPPPTGPPPRKRRRTVLMTAGLTASASVIAATVFGAQAENSGADDADSTSQTPWYGDPFLEDD